MRRRWRAALVLAVLLGAAAPCAATPALLAGPLEPDVGHGERAAMALEGSQKVPETTTDDADILSRNSGGSGGSYTVAATCAFAVRRISSGALCAD